MFLLVFQKQILESPEEYISNIMVFLLKVINNIIQEMSHSQNVQSTSYIETLYTPNNTTHV